MVSAEYSGGFLILPNKGMSFAKYNMKTLWKKTPYFRIYISDYCERSVFETLVNTMSHRDFLNSKDSNPSRYFARLGYMERQGSGLSKIRTAYENAANYQPGMEPTFRSNRVEFTVKLLNLNYKASNYEVLNEVSNDALTKKT